MTVEQGSRVTIDFTATYPDGELFDTSSAERAAAAKLESEKRFRPVVLEIGADPTIASLEAGLRGMDAGEHATIEVPHEDLQVTYDREAFESMVDGEPTVGREVHAMTGLLGEVVAVDPASVTVDFDPDRAGQTLTFEVEVVEVA